MCILLRLPLDTWTVYTCVHFKVQTSGKEDIGKIFYSWSKCVATTMVFQVHTMVTQHFPEPEGPCVTSEAESSACPRGHRPVRSGQTSLLTTGVKSGGPGLPHSLLATTVQEHLTMADL